MARPEAPSDIRGFGTLKKVFEILSQERNEVRLHVFGSDDLPSDFQCHRNLGRVAQDELPEIYSSTHVFVETSLRHGFGRTGVEAMACGTACVLSDSGGISEYAEDESNCLIVPTGEPETTARAILRLLDDEMLRRAVIRNGLDTVQRISVRRATDDLILLFRRLRTGHGEITVASNALRGQTPSNQENRGVRR
jgi:glycosyltransferase involved in cell wall biosynthesis